MIRNLLVISFCAAALSSCVIQPAHVVPDVPHDAMWRQRAKNSALAAQVNTPTLQTTTPHTATPAPTTTAAAQPAAVTPTPVAVTPKPVTPVTQPATKPASSGTHITQAPVAKPTPKKEAAKPAPTPVATPPKPTPTVTTPAPTPAPAVTNKKDLSSITNENGVIPYAVRVPGDPTRVYNPLAPDLTIRTVDRNTGKPLPKDTVLKVNGTNFMFKVP